MSACRREDEEKAKPKETQAAERCAVFASRRFVIFCSQTQDDKSEREKERERKPKEIRKLSWKLESQLFSFIRLHWQFNPVDR